MKVTTIKKNLDTLISRYDMFGERIVVEHGASNLEFNSYEYDKDKNILIIYVNGYETGKKEVYATITERSLLPIKIDSKRESYIVENGEKEYIPGWFNKNDIFWTYIYHPKYSLIFLREKFL